MNLDPAAARDHRLPRLPRRRSTPVGEELVCHAVRPGLPGPRRHPGPARRRGPQAGLTGRRHGRPGSTSPGSTTRPSLAAADPRLRALAESGARVRREAGEAAEATAEAVARASDAARPRAVDRRRPRLPAAARRARAVVPGAVRRLARTPACPAGPAASTSSSSSPPTAPTPGTASAVAEAVRRGCQVVVACPAELAGRRARRRPLDARSLPTVTRDQLATAVVMLEYLDQVGLGPRADPERGRRAPSTTSPSPARRTATSPSTPPRCWRSRSPTPTRSSGAARRSPPAPPAGSPSRSAAPPAGPRSPATPSTCCR